MNFKLDLKRGVVLTLGVLVLLFLVALSNYLFQGGLLAASYFYLAMPIVILTFNFTSDFYLTQFLITVVILVGGFVLFSWALGALSRYLENKIGSKLWGYLIPVCLGAIFLLVISLILEYLFPFSF